MYHALYKSRVLLCTGQLLRKHSDGWPGLRHLRILRPSRCVQPTVCKLHVTRCKLINALPIPRGFVEAPFANLAVQFSSLNFRHENIVSKGWTRHPSSSVIDPVYSNTVWPSRMGPLNHRYGGDQLLSGWIFMPTPEERIHIQNCKALSSKLVTWEITDPGRETTAAIVLLNGHDRLYAYRMFLLSPLVRVISHECGDL